MNKKSQANLIPGGTGAPRGLTPMRIGDVARMLGESEHVVRYWTNEFALYLRAPRSVGGQRFYSVEQVGVLRAIQHDLRVELYTIAGAKRQLRLAAERERRTG